LFDDDAVGYAQEQPDSEVLALSPLRGRERERGVA